MQAAFTSTSSCILPRTRRIQHHAAPWHIKAASSPHTRCNSGNSHGGAAQFTSIEAAPAPAPAPASTAQTAAPEAAPSEPMTEEARFHEAYSKAYTMSQLYVKNRPAAVPLSEWEARRKKRDMGDILVAARRRNKNQETVQKNLEQLQTILPDVIDLNKMKAADWVALSEDVPAAANKLIVLKTMYPNADVFSIIIRRPKTLLQSEQRISDNAQMGKIQCSCCRRTHKYS
eukprot:GHRR01019378.1.p1 GENE.GHRR01019378.1~~GHRR01019378.1.p1  ORF type:complete len:230 (+),score=55.04 GHRR01019378.1:169-858(+)